MTERCFSEGLPRLRFSFDLLSVDRFEQGGRSQVIETFSGKVKYPASLPSVERTEFESRRIAELRDPLSVRMTGNKPLRVALLPVDNKPPPPKEEQLLPDFG